MNPSVIAEPIPQDAGSATAAPRLRVGYKTGAFFVAVAEVVTITFGSTLGQVLYEHITRGPPDELNSALGVGVLSSILYVSIARSAGLYRLPTLINPVRHLRLIATCCALVLLSLTGLLFLLKIGSEFSRGALLGFAAAMVSLCVVTRVLAAGVMDTLVRRNAVVGRPAFLIGDPEELASLTPTYLLRQFGLQEVGRFALERTAGPQDSYHAQIADALALARSTLSKEFVLATNADSIERLTRIEQALRVTPLPVKLLPNQVFRSVLGRNDAAHEGSVHLIDLQRAPISLSEQVAKRSLDIALAGLAFLALSPILVIAACAIKWDSPGPVVFRQRRNGFNQSLFVIYKFRTMTVLEDGESVVQAQRGDRRVTRVGQILRRTSIDELPQLINVLKGDMSLVGPRPHALAHDNQYRAIIGDYSLRHHMKPGITGWAQVHGLRGETALTADMERRVELDLWYINNWSIYLDLQILLRTAFEVLKTDAY